MTGSSGNPYRYYTKEEIEAAKDTDLPDLLVSLGYHIKPVGRFHTALEMDSLRIFDRRTWFRYSESIGGDAIEFLRHFHGMSFSETVKFLLEYSGRDPTAPRPCQRPRPPPRPPFVLPPPNSDNQRVYAYLRRRGIAPGVIRDFVDAGLAYEDTNHNAVFVGYGSAGDPVFATKRGTGSVPFRCDVSGSDTCTGR